MTDYSIVPSLQPNCGFPKLKMVNLHVSLYIFLNFNGPRQKPWGVSVVFQLIHFTTALFKRAFPLTQIYTIHMGAPLLGHIDVQVEEAQRVSKVFSRTGVQHQHCIVGRGLSERLRVPVGSLGSVQHLAQAVASSSRLGAQQGGRGVGQDGQDFVGVP